MRILNHRLIFSTGVSPFRIEASPNTGGRFARPGPRALVIHYTAAGTLESTVSWFKQRRARASAHLVIGRDGEIAQMVPFDRIAWHAGRSAWRGLTGLNSHTIGIELCNWGPLTEAPGGVLRTWTGQEIAAAQCREARHRHEQRSCHWEMFSEPQILAALAASAALVERYGLDEILGHDDIAPTRKLDPGPLFPMEEFRSQLLGEAEAADVTARVAVDRLNIRERPGLDAPRLAESPLTLGTMLQFLEAHEAWRLVNVLDEQGRSWLTGWVHGAYLHTV